MKIFKTKTLAELEKYAEGEEVFERMVVELKKLSNDEKIAQQMRARADYESRIATARSAGIKEGSFTMLINLVNKGMLTVAAAKEANMTKEQFLKFLQGQEPSHL